MWSIWFYFPSGMLEVRGFASKADAMQAHCQTVFFKDDEGKDIFIPLSVQKDSIAKFCET